MYPIEVKISSKNGWQYPNEAKAYYGRYDRNGVTVHWWNSPDKIKDSDHDNIVNMKLRQSADGVGSVNYVLSNTKITLMVNPDDVAWCSQAGNPTTVSVEFSPHLNDEGYKKAGWLIWQLEGRYNRKLALYRHSDWFQTQCPGTLDLNRMRAEANKWASGGYNPAPTPPKTAKLTWTTFTQSKTYKTNKPVTNLWNFNNTSWNMTSVKQFKQGEEIVIAGQCVNETLGATYLVTKYSLDKKITNGFNQSDLDLVVIPPTPPKPVEPPKEEPKQPEKPVTPEVPKDDSDFEKRLSALEKLVQTVVDFLSSVFKNFKKG